MPNKTTPCEAATAIMQRMPANEGWRPAHGADPKYWSYTIENRSGMSINVNSREEGRLNIGVDCHPDVRNSFRNTGDPTSIGVSASKSPEAIWSDFNRRLLPDALTFWQKKADQLRSQQMYEQQRAEVFHRIVAAGQADGRRYHDPKDTINGHKWSTRSAVSPTAVKLELDCTPDQAEQVLRYWLQINPKPAH